MIGGSEKETEILALRTFTTRKELIDFLLECPDLGEDSVMVSLERKREESDSDGCNGQSATLGESNALTMQNVDPEWSDKPTSNCGLDHLSGLKDAIHKSVDDDPNLDIFMCVYDHRADYSESVAMSSGGSTFQRQGGSVQKLMSFEKTFLENHELKTQVQELEHKLSLASHLDGDYEVKLKGSTGIHLEKPGLPNIWISLWSILSSLMINMSEFEFVARILWTISRESVINFGNLMGALEKSGYEDHKSLRVQLEKYLDEYTSSAQYYDADEYY